MAYVGAALGSAGGRSPDRLLTKYRTKRSFPQGFVVLWGVLKAPEVVQREREWVRLESLVPCCAKSMVR